MADPEKVLDRLNRTVDTVRDIAIGVASAVTMLPKALVSMWKRRDEDK